MITQITNGDIQLPPRQGMAGCKVLKDEVQAITELKYPALDVE